MKMAKRQKIKFLLLAALSFAGASFGQSTFNDSFGRYLSGHDIFRLLAQKFPYAKSKGVNGCNSVTDSNAAFLGVPNTVNGEQAYRTPSPVFIRWYVKCLLPLIDEDLDFASETPNGMDRFFGKETLALLQGQSYQTVVSHSKTVPWMSLPVIIRNAIGRQLIHWYIGPQIVRDENGLVTKLSTIVEKKVKTTTSTFQALKKLISYLVLEDDFLAY